MRDLTALRALDPIAWAQRVREALELSGGNVGAAAAFLGVERRTLQRWFHDPLLSDLQRPPTKGPR